MPRPSSITADCRDVTVSNPLSHPAADAHTHTYTHAAIKLLYLPPSFQRWQRDKNIAIGGNKKLE